MVIYTVLQAIHSDDQLVLVGNDSNSRRAYLDRFLQHMALVNNDLRPPSIGIYTCEQINIITHYYFFALNMRSAFFFY